MTDIASVAGSIVAVVAPFTPYLLDMAKEGSKKLAEVIAEKGGESAWEQAQKVWAKIKDRFDGDDDVDNAVTMLAKKPEDDRRRDILVETLAEKLKSDKTLAQEFITLLGGETGIQQIKTKNTWVEDIEQRMTGSGNQTIDLTDSIAKGIKQIKN